MTHEVKNMIDGQPCFEKPLDEILATCKLGGAIKVLSPVEFVTDRQRRWYKGVCLPQLAKQDENGEPAEWWDTEVKRQCNGLSLLKKEIFFMEDALGSKIAVGRLTTRVVGKRNMTAFIEMILSRSMELGWDISPPDKDLRK